MVNGKAKQESGYKVCVCEHARTHAHVERKVVEIVDKVTE